MAQYEVFPNQEEVQRLVDRLRRHHDHLKTLDDCYSYMRQRETYERMRDSNFRCHPDEMEKLDTSYFTSLIVKLSPEQGKHFFENVEKAYQELANLVKQLDPAANVQIYFDSAHITIKSLLDGVKQNEDALRTYMPIIAPIVSKWLGVMGQTTKIYGIGLFTNLHKAKGLSVGVRFYPSLPLIQILRGEVGFALYGSEPQLELRPEVDFHTMLTHSTGFRARNLSLPFHTDFVSRFQGIVEKYDHFVFGAISDIRSEDVYVRNGQSDKLIPIAEVSVGDFG
jgi:hypothetical protein